jgi:hypothetical protein
VPGAPADTAGLRCPTFAHIRKANPRGMNTDQGSPLTTRQFQMLRRGITWGTEYSAAWRRWRTGTGAAVAGFRRPRQNRAGVGWRSGVHLMTLRRRTLPPPRPAVTDPFFAVGDQEGLSVIDIS